MRGNYTKIQFFQAGGPGRAIITFMLDNNASDKSDEREIIMAVEIQHFNDKGKEIASETFEYMDEQQVEFLKSFLATVLK